VSYTGFFLPISAEEGVDAVDHVLGRSHYIPVGEAKNLVTESDEAILSALSV